MNDTLHPFLIPLQELTSPATLKVAKNLLNRITENSALTSSAITLDPTGDLTIILTHPQAPPNRTITIVIYKENRPSHLNFTLTTPTATYTRTIWIHWYHTAALRAQDFLTGTDRCPITQSPCDLQTCPSPTTPTTPILALKHWKACPDCIHCGEECPNWNRCEGRKILPCPNCPTCQGHQVVPNCTKYTRDQDPPHSSYDGYDL